MRILTLNCGSSTLKFDVLDAERGAEEFGRLATGQIDRIGGEAEATLSAGHSHRQRSVAAADHRAAFDTAMDLLDEAELLGGVEAVGHRVVHGGSRFAQAALIDDAVVEAIQGVSELAPLHNDRALRVIEAARRRLTVPMVAAFDTAFFASLPPVAATYALPRQVREEHGIRRFGFHGLAHRYMVEEYLAKKPHATRRRLITLQLGSGSSATASVNGRPVDTSMGFTPLEGLIMGTRSGDIDPSIPLFLTKQAGLSPDEVESLLNNESGLLGVSGRSADVRDLLHAEQEGNADAELAIDMFCRSVRKYIGSYLAIMGGADALIFGGGIGENSPEIRARVCEGMQWAGIVLEPHWNRRTSQGEVIISDDESPVEVWVMCVDEARIIAEEVMSALEG